MPAERRFLRPPELLAGIFHQGKAFGYVDWEMIDEDPGHAYWEAKGYGVAGEPIVPRNSRVIAEKRIGRALETYYANIWLEFLDAWIGRASFPPTTLCSPWYMADALQEFINGGSMEFTAAGMVGPKLHVALFFLPRNPRLPDSFFLPQVKPRRRGIVLFGVKRTRSNEKDFANFRVPHK